VAARHENRKGPFAGLGKICQISTNTKYQVWVSFVMMTGGK